MKIIYTKHAEEKFAFLEILGWNITKKQIQHTIQSPTWVGTSRFGQKNCNESS